MLQDPSSQTRRRPPGQKKKKILRVENNQNRQTNDPDQAILKRTRQSLQLIVYTHVDCM